MKIKDVFKDYLDYAEFYLEFDTWRTYKRDLKLITKVLDVMHIYDTTQLDANIIDKLNRYLKGNTEKKNSKINDTVSTFISSLNHSNISTKHFKMIRLKNDTIGYKPLPENELILMLDYIEKLNTSETNNLSWVASIYIMLDTGARINEVTNILTKNVDVSGRRILLEETKNGKMRIVPFGDLSADIIGKIYDPNHSHLLWNYYSDIKLSRVSLHKFLKRLSDKLNLTSGNITSHRFRKTFATRLLKMKCPITTIQKLLGHSSISITMRYLEIDDYMLEKDYIEHYSYNALKKAD